MDDTETDAFGRNCLLARRLVERGVRFVQLYHGAGSKWDAHSGLESNHAEPVPVDGQAGRRPARRTSSGAACSTRPWSSGAASSAAPRCPRRATAATTTPTASPCGWPAAASRAGTTIGATDEVGLHAIEDRLHVHDLHATILHLLGLDHTRLIYRHKGRPERPTLNEGEAYRKIATG